VGAIGVFFGFEVLVLSLWLLSLLAGSSSFLSPMIILILLKLSHKHGFLREKGKVKTI